LTVNNDSTKTNLGRSWNVEKIFNTFAEAVTARTVFLKENEKMQAKIKFRRLKNNFVLKTRLLAEFVKQENKKRGKNKRRNKKTSNRGKFDASAAV
jgi:E3 ubiquitin-protein ligase DOA10